MCVCFETIDKLRTWVERHSPGKLEEVLGALMPFAEAEQENVGLEKINDPNTRLLSSLGLITFENNCTLIDCSLGRGELKAKHLLSLLKCRHQWQIGQYRKSKNRRRELRKIERSWLLSLKLNSTGSIVCDDLLARYFKTLETSKYLHQAFAWRLTQAKWLVPHSRGIRQFGHRNLSRWGKIIHRRECFRDWFKKLPGRLRRWISTDLGSIIFTCCLTAVLITFGQWLIQDVHGHQVTITFILPSE